MPDTAPALPADPVYPTARRLIAGGRPQAALRSIAALILREVSTRFGRQPGGYAWVIINPLGMIIMLSLAFSFIQRAPGLGTSFMLFKGTGFLVFTHFRAISSMIGAAMRFSKPLLVFPAITWIDTIIARFLLNSLVAFVATVLILGGVIIFEGLTPVLDWIQILQAMLLALLLGLGIGCLNCYLVMRIDVWDQAWNIFTAPLMVVSGVLILFEDMPLFARELLWYNPLVHITGLMRAGFYSTYNPNYISIPYVLACALIPMALGLLLLRRYHRQLLQR